MANTYTADVRAFGTLYIQADSIEQARERAKAVSREWLEWAGNSYPLSEDVELSCDMTLNGLATEVEQWGPET